MRVRRQLESIRKKLTPTDFQRTVDSIGRLMDELGSQSINGLDPEQVKTEEQFGEYMDQLIEADRKFNLERDAKL